MAGEMASAIVKLGADIGDFERKMSKAQKAFDDLGRKTEELGKALTTRLTLPLLAVGGAAVKFATDMDNLKRGLTAVTGSGAETEKQLKRLRDVARLPGLGFEEAIRGSVRLQAAGFSATLAEDALKGFGNALATVGAGKAELDQVTRALSQIASKGKISAEEINQIAEVVPQIRVVMQEAFGTANSELLSKAGIDATEFVRKVTDELLKLEQVTGGPANAFENLADSAKLAAVNLGDSLLPPVIKMVDGLSALAEKFQAVDANTMRTIVAIGVAVAAIGPFLIVVGKLTVGITALSAALSIGLVPLLAGGGAVIIGLTALSAWFIKNKLDAMAAAGAADEYKRSLSGLAKAELIARAASIASRADALRAQRDALPATVALATGSFLGGGQAQMKNPQVDKLTQGIDSLEAQLREVVSAFNGLEAAASGGGGGGGGLAGANPFAAFGGMPAGMGFGPIVPGQAGARPKGVLDLGKKSGHAPQGSVNMAPPPGFMDRVGGAAKGFGGDILGGLAKGAGALLNAFNPLTIIATVFKASLEAVTPALEAMRPMIEIVAQIMGKALVPILEGLFPIFKLTAIAATYLGQIFFNVAGGIAIAVGSLIYALGWAVDKIPFMGDFGLKGLGNDIKAAGNGFIGAASALGEARDEIKKIEWDDAAKGADAFADAATSAAESITNSARIVNLNLLRYRASTAGMGDSVGTGGGGGSGGTGGGGSGGTGGGGDDGADPTVPGSRPPLPATPNPGPNPVTPGHGGGVPGSRRDTVTINGGITIQAAPGEDGESLWNKLNRTIQEKAAAGLISPLTLAVGG